MKNEFGYSDRDIQFGKTKDSPNISFISVLDIDHQVTKVPYTNSMTTISQLINTYWKITSHQNKFKSKPCFRILVGAHKNQIVDQKKDIYYLGASVNEEVCLRVEDKDFPNNQFSEKEVANPMKSVDEKDDVVSLILLKAGKKIRFSIKNKETIKNMKLNLTRVVGQLKNVQPSMILLYCGEIKLEDEKKVSDYILSEEIKIFQIRKEGSFKGNTLVLTQEDGYIPIQDLKPNDKIMTINRHTFEKEPSSIASIAQTLQTQSVVLRLKNGVEIETTPDHLLLCEDGIFRLIKSNDSKEVCLRQGLKLKLQNGNDQEIMAIETKLIPPEVFYSITPEKNKNIIVSKGFISHQQYIKVKAPNGIIQAVDVTPSDNFAQIKQKLQICFNINSKNQSLVSRGQKLKDQFTILDIGLPNGAVCILKNVDFDQNISLMHPENTFLCHQDKRKQVKVSELDNTNLFVAVDIEKNVFQEGFNLKQISTEKVKQYIALTFFKNVLRISLETNILLENNKIMKACQYYEEYKESPLRFCPKLKTPSQEEYLQLQEMELIKQPKEFYKISTDAHNYVVNNVIIPNFVFDFIVISEGTKKRKISLNLSRNIKVIEIKEKLQPLIDIPAKYQFFTFNNERLNDEQTLADRNIDHQHVIIVRENDEKIYQSSIFVELEGQEYEQIQSKKIVFQFDSGKKVTLEYNPFKNWQVKKIFHQYMDIDDPSYFIIFSTIIIFSNEELNKLETSPSFKDSNCSVFVLKNEKLSFISTLDIRKEDIMNSSCILFENEEKLKNIPQKSKIKVSKSQQFETEYKKAEKAIKSSKIKKTHLKNEHFYNPFLYFTSRKYHKDVYDHIRNFDKYREEVHHQDSVFSIIKDLYCNMNMLANHLKICYYGVRNFRASMFLSPGHTFFLHNFTLSYLEKNNVISEIQEHSGTLFHIQSTSGKIISEYAVHPEKKQILFAPFTYFLVEKIEVGQKKDEVWLTQISSPITFKKNIILWVDDNPHYNQVQYDQILNKKDEIQILQLTSTTAAEKWIIEFGWILSWKGLEFKLISDMGRVEWKGKELVENREAGVDLLQLLYKIRGYSAKTLIFCGNQDRANKIAQKRQIPIERYHITDKEGDLLTYVGLKNQ